MSSRYIELESKDAVATIVLNRPEAMNAFIGTMRDDLLAAIEEVASSDARVLVVTGAGRAFCSGGDVRYMAQLREEGNDGRALKPLIEQGKRVVLRLRSLPIPTLAVLNGVAAGAGLGLALACDLRIASSQARLGATFSRVGLHPDWGTSYFLTRLAGADGARDLVFTGRLIGAKEAWELGLVNWVVEPDELDEFAHKRIEELRDAAPLSIRTAKETIARAETASLEETLDVEERAQLDCFRTEDALEGFRAFGEKRRPSFKGR
jgi:2-(1,2-epoxy-1,2-dihydrophenyl)acetyl-CoA isomerase